MEDDDGFDDSTSNDGDIEASNDMGDILHMEIKYETWNNSDTFVDCGGV